jgi:hypothetical protein
VGHVPGALTVPAWRLEACCLPGPAAAVAGRDAAGAVSGRTVPVPTVSGLSSAPPRSGEATSLPPCLGDALGDQGSTHVAHPVPGCYDSDTESPCQEGKQSRNRPSRDNGRSSVSGGRAPSAGPLRDPVEVAYLGLPRSTGAGSSSTNSRRKSPRCADGRSEEALMNHNDRVAQAIVATIAGLAIYEAVVLPDAVPGLLQALATVLTAR